MTNSNTTSNTSNTNKNDETHVTVSDSLPNNNPPDKKNPISSTSSPEIPASTYAHLPDNNFYPGNLPVYENTRYAEVAPESPVLNECWQYGKSVKLFACLDGFICFLNAFVIWPWIFLLIGPYLGYKGAKEYDTKLITAYIIYSSFLFVARIIILIQIYNGTYSDDDKIMTSGSIFLNWLSTFARAWITWMIYKLSSKLNSLTTIQLNTLKIGTYIPIITSIVYY